MGDEPLQQTGWEQAEWVEATAFQPSARLRTRLLWGCFATLAGGALGVGSVVGKDPMVRLALDLACVPALIVIIAAYLLLAQEVGSLGLRRTALGAIGLLALLSLSSLMDPNEVGAEVAVGALVALIVGTIAVLGAVAHRPTWAGQPAKPDEASSTQQKAGWGSGLGFLIIVKLFVLGKLGRFLFRGGWDLEEVALVSVGILLLLLVVFMFLAGVVKIRLMGRLGVTSALLGLVEIIAPIAVAGLAVAYLLDVAALVGNAGPLQEGEEEALIEQVDQAWQPTLTAAAIGVHAAWSIMTVLFFWIIRGGADPEEVLSAYDA
jgi:phage-related holin